MANELFFEDNLKNYIVKYVTMLKKDLNELTSSEIMFFMSLLIFNIVKNTHVSIEECIPILVKNLVSLEREFKLDVEGKYIFGVIQ